MKWLIANARVAVVLAARVLAFLVLVASPLLVLEPETAAALRHLAASILSASS